MRYPSSQNRLETITISMTTYSIKAYGRGCTVGHSMTSIWPSASRSSVGAYSPNNSRRHHIPVEHFCLMVVNSIAKARNESDVVAP